MRVCVALLASSLLASCGLAPKPSRTASNENYSSNESFSEKEYGVVASPRVVAKADAVPKGGGRYHVGKPYEVAGKTYRPKEDPNYAKVGYASWYGQAFHGRKTANGEVYDMGELTAAHPTLPLPSYVRVTNMANNRSVVVRVNDRGPFKKGRIIDVSATAAEMLDFKRAGTAKVKVEYVGRARMDGHDRQMLVASYRGPNDLGGGDTLFALAPTVKPKRFVLAALAPQRRPQAQSDRSTDRFGAQDPVGPTVATPAYQTFSPSGQGNPLILATGFVSSYAPTDRLSRAHLAASAQAQGGKSAAVVQLGTYSEKTNAERVAQLFAKYGESVASRTTASDRTLFVVRVTVDGPSAPVLSAARAAGIADAYVISR